MSISVTDGQAGPDAVEPHRTAGRRLDLSHERRLWLATVWLVGLYLLLLSAFDRYLEFDEAVFYSQSGGFEGSAAPPNVLAASREMGTWLLIGAIRALGFELAGVRLVWAGLTVAVMLLAFREVGRWCGRWTATVGLVLFATFWTTALFTGSFYGSQAGAVLMLLATGVYLRLREADRGALAIGLLLGLVVAAGFYLRHVESLLVVVVLAGHALVWRPGRFWRDQAGAVAAALATFGVVFVVPWSLWSAGEYGSVLDRLRAARAQGHPLSLHNGLGEWAGLLTGDSVAYVSLSPLPSWPRVVIAVGGTALIAGLVWAVVRAARRAGPSPSGRRHTGLLLTLTAVSFGFFFFVSGIVRARYSMHGLAFGAALTGQLIGEQIEAWRLGARRTGTGRRAVLGAVAAMAAVWIGAQATLVHAYQTSREQLGHANLVTAHTMRALAGDQPCEAITAWGRTHLQNGSGCVTVDGLAVDEVAAAADRLTRTGRPVFVFWPAEDRDRLNFDDDWGVIERPHPYGTAQLLYYHLRTGGGEAAAGQASDR